MATAGKATARNLTVLLATIFLIACAEELWAKFIPNYLRVLGASVGWIAVYGAAKDFLDAIYQFPGGVLAAHLGYKRAFVLFNVLAVAGYLAFAFAAHWWVVLLALPLVMAWQSFSLPATFSLIGDSLPRGERSVAFAYQSIIRRIPVAVAPIVGGLIITAYGVLAGTRIAIVIGVAIAIVALLVQITKYRDAAQAIAPPFAVLVRGIAGLAPPLKALLVSDIVVRFGQGIGEIFIVLYAVNVIGISSALFGWLVGLAMATSVVVYLPVARIADTRGRVPWVTLTYAFFALFPLSLAFTSTAWMLPFAFVLMGLREIGEPPRKAMIVDLARADRRSVDVGTYYLIRGLAVFPASLVGGVLWARSPRLTFLAAAGVAAIGMIVFAVTARRFKPDSPTETT